MPTYEYVCQSCGTHVEVYQRFSDDPLTECGLCGGPLRKVFHPAGILFKGSGFYVTDSRASAKGDGAKRTGRDREKAATGSSAEGGSTAGSSDGSKAGSKEGSTSAGASGSKERSA